MDLRIRKVQRLVIDLTRTQTPGLSSELPLAALLNLPLGSPWTTTQDTLGQSLGARSMEEGLAGSSSVMRTRMMALTVLCQTAYPLLPAGLKQGETTSELKAKDLGAR